MMHIIEPSDLRKESGKRFIVALTEFDGTSPIVAPLNHCARLQAIRSHLVNVTAHSIGNLWPITERQQILQMTRPQIGATFAHQFQIFLWKTFQIDLRKKNKTHAIYILDHSRDPLWLDRSSQSRRCNATNVNIDPCRPLAPSTMRSVPLIFYPF